MEIFEDLCRKVPEDARVAKIEQLPIATGLIRPLLLIVQVAGVVDVNEYVPSPLPPPATACAVSRVVKLVFDIPNVTSELCGARTPKKLCAFATTAN